MTRNFRTETDKAGEDSGSAPMKSFNEARNHFQGYRASLTHPYSLSTELPSNKNVDTLNIQACFASLHSIALHILVIPPMAVGGYFKSSPRKDLNDPPTAVGGISTPLGSFG